MRTRTPGGVGRAGKNPALTRLGLAPGCVFEARVDPFPNDCVITKGHFAKAVLFRCIFAFLVLSFVSLTEAASFPKWKATDEFVDFKTSGALSVGAWAVRLAEKPSSDRFASFIEFFPFVASDGEPVADQKAGEKGQQWYQHWRQWVSLVAWFLLGLLVGSQTGARPPKKPEPQLKSLFRET